LTYESKYSEESRNNFGDEIYRQEKELKEIKAMLYKSSYWDKNCDCHKKVLSHGHNPCVNHNHGHHHNKCFCNHHDHGNHHSSCFSSHHGHGHCEDFFLVDHCYGPKAFSHNNCCNKHFSLHLAGLTGNLNFQFFRKKGCCAKVEFECESETKSLVGRVCAIGIDFVDILKNDKTVVTIMKQRICTIHWLDKCDHDSNLLPCDTDDEEVEEVEVVGEVDVAEEVEKIDASLFTKIKRRFIN